MSNLPTHIAIIPDGNRRWAKKHLLPAFMGHREGAKTAEKVFEAALEAGVTYLSFWGASISNITKRSAEEVSFLSNLFEEQFKRLLTDPVLEKYKVRVRVLGTWRQHFSAALVAIIEEIEAKTAAWSGRHLTFLLAYNGTEEMINAVQKIVASGQKEIGENTIKQHLYTRELPPVDLVIRTGEENGAHNSAGFMMWDTAESQLYFTALNWPDFSPEELKKALADYAQRERRMGK